MHSYSTAPLPRLQALNARHLQQALQDTAQATIHRDADAGPLVARQETSETGLDAFLARALVLALADHPYINAHYGIAGVNLYREVGLGVMVAREDGVIVPVIQEADALSLADLDAAIRATTERARSGGLALNDTRGATFTMANLGPWDVDHFTPILVPNMVATLGVGRIRRVCEPTDEGCRPAHRIALSLTFDHRALHGVTAARFLASVADRLAAPETL
jgi:pyruvate dehydrogenase E2 component (dihydrolipoamide acetyltransferase)